MSNVARANKKVTEMVLNILNVKLPDLVRDHVEIPNADYIVKSIELLDDECFFRVRFTVVGREDEYVWFFRVSYQE